MYTTSWEALFDKNALSQLESQIKANSNKSYPPVNIFSEDEATFIHIATSGFKKSELEIVLDKDILKVSGKKQTPDNKNFTVKQISGKEFKREFVLSEYAEVDLIEYVDGILSIKLILNIPEEQKPRKFEIK